MLSRIAQSPVPDLRLRGVPNGLADTIERAMAKDPAQRWEDADAMADALRSAASGRSNETVDVKRETLPPLPRAPPDRRRRRTFSAVLAGVVAIGLGARRGGGVAGRRPTGPDSLCGSEHSADNCACVNQLHAHHSAGVARADDHLAPG